MIRQYDFMFINVRLVMKTKIALFSVLIIFATLLPANALYEDFKKLDAECLATIAKTKKSIKKFPAGKIIEPSKDDNYVLDNPHYTGKYYFVKGEVGDPSDGIVYKDEVYFYVQSQLPAMNPLMTGGKCKELLPFKFSFIPTYYDVKGIPTNAILEYNKEDNTLKVLKKDSKLFNNLLKIVKAKRQSIR